MLFTQLISSSLLIDSLKISTMRSLAFLPKSSLLVVAIAFSVEEALLSAPALVAVLF